MIGDEGCIDQKRNRRPEHAYPHSIQHASGPTFSGLGQPTPRPYRCGHPRLYTKNLISASTLHLRGSRCSTELFVVSVRILRVRAAAKVAAAAQNGFPARWCERTDPSCWKCGPLWIWTMTSQRGESRGREVEQRVAQEIA